MKSTKEQIRTALASAYPLTLLVSQEEERMVDLLRGFASAARPNPLPVQVWNCVEGFGPEADPSHRDPMKALGWLASQEAPHGLYFFKDLGELLDDRNLLRRLRDTAVGVRNSGRFIFLIRSTTELPELLKPLTYIVMSLYPDESEVRPLVASLVDPARTQEETIDRLVSALRGMSMGESEYLLRRLLTQHKDLDDDFFQAVLDEKEQISRKEGIIEFISPDESLSDLGGLDLLKEWVDERKKLFLPEARAAGVPSPKGVLLMGISGCGKSLAVKVIAQKWRLPLFRLDMNLVFSGTYGSAEWVFHRALEAMESLAPAVLWIDEIEMGVAGYHEGETGSITRIFSTFLTWMQEHKEQVFVAATANRINLLPAEILRKGRFDQVFFVDLPNDEERKEILKIHLRRIGLDPAVYDLMLLGSATRGWNGAEIEQAAIQARVTGEAKDREVSQNDLLAAFGKIIPLSKTMEEQIKSIRSWARTRAVPASPQARPEV